MQWNEKSINNTLNVLMSLCALSIMPNGGLAGSLEKGAGAESGDGDFFSEIELGGNDGHSSTDSAELDKRWHVNGFVKQEFNYAVRDQGEGYPFSRQDEGVRQFRSTVNVSLKGEVFSSGSYEISANTFYDSFYHHSSKAQVTPDEHDAMADEAEWREVFVNAELLDDVWLKAGRQVVAWGQSDYTQILDLVNPRDEREFGLVDLEDSRLPIAATRLSYVGKRWGSDVVFTHEFEPNRWAGSGADFDPLIALRSDVNVVGAVEPDVGLDDPGYLARVFVSSRRGDISIIYGNVHERTPALAMVQGAGNDVVLVYPEIEAVGVAANWINGFWLLKAELARKSGVPVPRRDWPAQFAAGPGSGRLYEERTVHQLLGGVEYAGFQDMQMSLEWVTDAVDEYDKALAREERESFLSSRINLEFFHDTASLEFVWARWIEGRSDSLRVAYSYDVSDTVKLSAGYIEFDAHGEGDFLHPYRNNDRLFGAVRYSF